MEIKGDMVIMTAEELSNLCVERNELKQRIKTLEAKLEFIRTTAEI